MSLMLHPPAHLASTTPQGIRFLQQHDLLGNTPNAVALFLRDAAFLDKKQIGNYLGDPYGHAGKR